MRANEILQQAAKTYEERNEIYKDNYYYVGHILSMLFPDGLTIKDPNDWNRIHLIILGVVKQTRYAQNFANGGHQDSIRDQIVYGAMLEEVDGVINGHKQITKQITDQQEDIVKKFSEEGSGQTQANSEGQFTNRASTAAEGEDNSEAEGT